MWKIDSSRNVGGRVLRNVTAYSCVTDIPDVSCMVPDLAWCVAEQLTAQQLFDAEQRPDFLSLNLGMITGVSCHHVASICCSLSHILWQFPPRDLLIGMVSCIVQCSV